MNELANDEKHVKAHYRPETMLNFLAAPAEAKEESSELIQPRPVSRLVARAEVRSVQDCDAVVRAKQRRAGRHLGAGGSAQGEVNIKNTALLVSLLLIANMSVVLAADDMKAFPQTEKGMVRYVLQLPKHEDESLYKVELIVGKTVKVDTANQYFFGGRIEAETIVGWGYTRFMVRQLGPMAGTMMAIDPDGPKVDRFVTIRGEPYLIRYNSRLPVVVYVPEGVEVRYRIWRAEPEAKAMKPG